MSAYRERMVELPAESVLGWASDMVLDRDMTQPAIPLQHWHILGEPDRVLDRPVGRQFAQ